MGRLAQRRSVATVGTLAVGLMLFTAGIGTGAPAASDEGAQTSRAADRDADAVKVALAHLRGHPADFDVNDADLSDLVVASS